MIARGKSRCKMKGGKDEKVVTKIVSGKRRRESEKITALTEGRSRKASKRTEETEREGSLSLK